MKIQIEINNHQGSQLINILKQFNIEFLVEHNSSHEFVDLGLPSGLKWATCNVGAKTPTECGNHFRWGETTDACEMYGNSAYDYNKPFEDAATYHMGKAWRMPTKEDSEELCNNTTSKWVENYQDSGVNGRLFTSKVNGNELFFPAAGGCSYGSVVNVGSFGSVWSSSLDTSNPNYANYLYFSSMGILPMFNCDCSNGRSVRGVRN